MDYITLKEASQKWNVTPRQINYLCTSGRIPGAVKMATIWLIPKNAEKRAVRQKHTIPVSALLFAVKAL